MATDSKGRWSFHLRLFVSLLTLFVAFLACCTVFQYIRERQFRIDLLDERLQIFNAQLGEALRRGQSPDGFIASQRDVFGQVRVTIIDSTGRVRYDSVDPAEAMSDHSRRHEVTEAMRTGYGYTLRRLSEGGGYYFYSASLIDGQVIRSALSYELPLSDVLRADRHFLVFMLAVALAMSLAAYFFTRRLGGNITRLRRFAMRADRGEPVGESEPFAADELGEISDHIVRLYGQLQKTKDELMREHAKVQHEQEEKIRIKRQLTDNINHELKTPVSAIQGYLETIIDNPDLPPATIRSFVEKCRAQSERLALLLQDVTTLNRMDDAAPAIARTEVDLSEVVREIIAEVALRPPLHRMRIECDFLDRQLPMEGNRQLLHSIFGNLTDNAIAHSCGRDIRISLTGETDDAYAFSFADNGVGVEPEHLGRLFERFYRADDGRSRKAGGTGLGLAIVKNAVIFHGGTISVALRDKGGLEFTFTLKKHPPERP